MTKYITLLRGVNVGGKGLLKMSNLQTALTEAGFDDVRTYIQSGNIIFSSSIADTEVLAKQVAALIETSFELRVAVAVRTKQQWQDIMQLAPTWWGTDPLWKHNLLIMVGNPNMASVVKSIGLLKPDIEAMQAGDGVLYQSMSRELFGKTTTGKLASTAVYKQMTIRNYNTAVKIHELLQND